jgi:hypothetical protein
MGSKYELTGRIALVSFAMFISCSQARSDEELVGKVMCGYQGWFRVPADGSGGGWHHYAAGPKFDAEHATIELWPDVSELPAEDRFDTDFRKQDGTVAQVFSSVRPATTDLHFRWMKEYEIDGVFLQRFSANTRDAKQRTAMDQVLQNVQTSAKKHSRVWGLMYDLSGTRPEQFVLVEEDFSHLQQSCGVAKDLDDPHYVKFRGQPLIALWGLGFSDRPPALDEWARLIQFFKQQGYAVMVGVPTYWRTLDRDTIADSRLHELLHSIDVLSPWTVGRVNSPAEAKSFVDKTAIDDAVWCRERYIEYMPVAFPGFSWQNLQRTRGEEARFDQISRRGGEFFWAQCWNYRRAGARTLYVAMFDELDEGTAILKFDKSPPVGAAKFLTEDVPSDHYLWLTGRAGELFEPDAVPQSEAMPVRD